MADDWKITAIKRVPMWLIAFAMLLYAGMVLYADFRGKPIRIWGPVVGPAGASKFSIEESAIFTSNKWQDVSNSANAPFCALTYVDEDKDTAGCEVAFKKTQATGDQKADNVWQYKGLAKKNACRVACIYLDN